MALIQRNREPTPNELKVFGLLLAPFFGMIGVLVLWGGGSWAIPTMCWTIAVLSATLYHCVSSIRRPMYMAWMAVMYPIGWAINHLLLAVVYYGWITPVGLLMRVFGYDPMRRRLNRKTGSHWIKREPVNNVNRYFRQY